MNLRVYSLLFCAILLVSCDFFQKKKITEDEMIDTIINYKSVDIFPLFPSCENIPSEEKQRVCSQIKLSEHIFASLTQSNIVTERKVQDTLLVKLLVDSVGNVLLRKVNVPENVRLQIPTIDSLLESSVTNIPKLEPAYKRGMPVATEFTLPIVIVN